MISSAHRDLSPPPSEEPLERDGLDRALIARIVREFYRRVRLDARLGPIFAREITGDWEPHLEKMTDFWCSVILKNGAYQGRPVPAHLKLKDVKEEDFEVWLRLFRATTADLCDTKTAEVSVDRAERIAESLKLAMFFKLPRANGRSAQT